MTRHAAIGFRAKTGRAIAVALVWADAGPEYIARWEMALHDPKLPATSQPHHEVMELTWSQAQAAVRPLEARIERLASKALSSLLADLCGRGLSVIGIGVVGSPDRPLERIGNPHIRAHAAEGILFRNVLETAAGQHNVPCRSFSDKTLAVLAPSELGCRTASIQSTLAAFGKIAGSPWRTDERAAATAAWIMLRR